MSKPSMCKGNHTPGKATKRTRHVRIPLKETCRSELSARQFKSTVWRELDNPRKDKHYNKADRQKPVQYARTFHVSAPPPGQLAENKQSPKHQIDDADNKASRSEARARIETGLCLNQLLGLVCIADRHATEYDATEKES